MSKAQINFEDWMQENAGEIEQAQAFSTDGFPEQPAGIAEALSRSSSEYARMGYLLADADRFLIGKKAEILTRLLRDRPELTVDDRTLLVQDGVKDVRRVRDILQVTVAALKQKSFALMNTNKVSAGDRSLSRQAAT